MRRKAQETLRKDHNRWVRIRPGMCLRNISAVHVSGTSPPEESVAVFGDLSAMRPVLGYELYFAIQTAGNGIVRIGHAEPYPK
jgi:hypothetical protein